MKKLLFILAVCISGGAFAQAVTVKAEKDAPWKKIYRGEATKINDLVHTKLEAGFDYNNAWLKGKVWITLKPHFYPTDSLQLDAKAMQINEVALIAAGKKKPLKYSYDSMNLKITLDRVYKNGEQYTIFIDYIAKPNEFKGEGSAAITDAKGLYFINPKGEDSTKPIQIWTQGETEGTSVWIPIIDKPNQKTTQEFSLTVPAKYVTLSNGLLVAQKKNADGTRTDTWKMDLPNSPYLFFMGVGDYAVIKDQYKGKEVSYYVEKEYAPVARKIFGNTPEMMKFFSEKLGVDYPWQKYAQIVGRDYVSGAMENTTATLHQESANQNARQLLDENIWEGVIAHELFHHWFGDLVTAESWSNLTVNESFADFSETMWEEYKYGKDAGDEHNFQALQNYLYGGGESKDLVRFYYRSHEDMFDVVSYQKGGRILNMLRHYMGEDAFYKSLNKFLTDNKFKNGEAHQLRLAFEAVTGQDLNWFFNQWYFSSGHPVLKIDYNYNDDAGKAQVIIKQNQKGEKVYRLPINIDIYTGGTKTRQMVWMTNKTDTFTFSYTKRPDLINVDGDKILLCEKTDNKTAENYKAQFTYAPLYLDRREALDYFAKNDMPELMQGLKDKYAGLRRYTLQKIGEDTTLLKQESTLSTIESLIKTEKDRKTKARAIALLGKSGLDKYKSLYMQYVGDSSYSIAGAALEALSSVDPGAAYSEAKKVAGDAKGSLAEAVSSTMMNNGTAADFDFIYSSYLNMPPGQQKFEATGAFCDYLAKLDNETQIIKGVDAVLAFKALIPSSYSNFTDPVFKAALGKLASAKGGEVATHIENALK